MFKFSILIGDPSELISADRYHEIFWKFLLKFSLQIFGKGLTDCICEHEVKPSTITFNDPETVQKGKFQYSSGHSCQTDPKNLRLTI